MQDEIRKVKGNSRTCKKCNLSTGSHEECVERNGVLYHEHCHNALVKQAQQQPPVMVMAHATHAIH